MTTNQGSDSLETDSGTRLGLCEENLSLYIHCGHYGYSVYQRCASETPFSEAYWFLASLLIEWRNSQSVSTSCLDAFVLKLGCHQNPEGRCFVCLLISAPRRPPLTFASAAWGATGSCVIAAGEAAARRQGRDTQGRVSRAQGLVCHLWPRGPSFPPSPRIPASAVPAVSRQGARMSPAAQPWCARGAH
jgi:hypothetical protein